MPATPASSAQLRTTSRRRGREATETELVDALDRVVRRRGLRNVGVNEVIKEAGVGKALLYRYFGSLSGLVEAWGEKRYNWPTKALLKQLAALAEDDDGANFIKKVVAFHAQSLREDPLRVELLAEQLLEPSTISPALERIRLDAGRQYFEVFEQHPHFLKHCDLIRFMLGSVSYVAMRAAKAPVFMGIDLASDEDWQAMMVKFDEMIDAALARAAQ